MGLQCCLAVKHLLLEVHVTPSRVYTHQFRKHAPCGSNSGVTSGWLGRRVHCPVTRPGGGPVSGALTGLTRPAPLALSPDPWPAAYFLLALTSTHGLQSSGHCSNVLLSLEPAICLSVCSATSAHFGGGGGGNACLLFPGYREMPETRRLTLDLTAHRSQPST